MSRSDVTSEGSTSLGLFALNLKPTGALRIQITTIHTSEVDYGRAGIAVTLAWITFKKLQHS